MPYIQFIGAATDPCTVILLTHLDELPMVNVAPYAITTNPSGYSIDTSVRKFGTGAFGGGSSGAEHRIDFSGQPGGGVACVNGKFQIEHWYQRTGGTGPLSSGNQWDHAWYLEFDDGTWLEFVIGNAFFPSDSTYRRTFILSVSSSVTGYDEFRTADFDFLPDDNFHAIRCAMDGSGNFAMLVDGAIVASGTLTATVPAGAHIVDMAWGDVRTGQRMDEARVILGAADLAEYTPATGAWSTADCDSGVGVAGWTLIGTLTASDAAASDQLGSTPMSVCMNRAGTICVVGCPSDDSGKGTAYVFTRTGDVWSQAQKLTATGGAAGDAFGTSVAISGNGSVIAVGAPGDDNGLGTNAGSVYVFTGTPGSCAQVQRLESSSSVSTVGVGTSLAISETGTTIATGAPNDAGDEGTTYVFAGTPGSMTEQAALYDAVGLVNAFQGYSVALSSNGDVLAAGAPGYSSSAGRIDIYTRSGSTWSFAQSLQRSDAAGGQFFGSFVSLDDAGTVLAAGNDSSTTPRVAFFRKTTSWAEATTERTVFRAVTALLDGGGTRLIGTHTGSDSFEFNRFVGAQWTASHTFDYPDNFGASAWFAKDGGHLAVCAPLDDTAASNAGAVYFFKYSS